MAASITTVNFILDHFFANRTESTLSAGETDNEREKCDDGGVVLEQTIHALLIQRYQKHL